MKFILITIRTEQHSLNYLTLRAVCFKERESVETTDDENASAPKTKKKKRKKKKKKKQKMADSNDETIKQSANNSDVGGLCV